MLITHTVSQEISYLLWNPNFHYCVDKGPSVVPIVSQTHQAHNFLPYFPKMNSNYYLPIYT